MRIRSSISSLVRALWLQLYRSKMRVFQLITLMAAEALSWAFPRNGSPTYSPMCPAPSSIAINDGHTRLRRKNSHHSTKALFTASSTGQAMPKKARGQNVAGLT